MSECTFPCSMMLNSINAAERITEICESQRKRAQKAEQEVERLREELKKSACRYCPLKLKQEEKEARR